MFRKKKTTKGKSSGTTKKNKQDKKTKAIKKEVDGITFASTMEADYYLYLKEEKSSGRVKEFELQPVYVLLESYKKYGRTIRGIKYISDFLVTYADGSEVIIDVKGRETDDFKLKRKLFDFKYPDLHLKLVIWDSKNKCWTDYDEFKKAKSAAKRKKSAENRKREKGDSI